MRNFILANRYAKAFYVFAKEKGEEDSVFNQMRVVEEALSCDKEVENFINSPLVRPSEKVKAVEAAISKLELSESLKNFILLLTKKSRLALLPEILTAYQNIADEAHGVTRGVVRSATLLGPEERKQIEQLVSKATKKQVILSYKEDPSLLGGLVAQVGSFTFDDSLTSHLNRINEQLTRSVQ